ncbi:MAG: glycosyltransferase family 9 protein [Rubripirellula sp.]|nr:glycosyltransferase family 9 protein [Rubripirellula sp.]
MPNWIGDACMATPMLFALRARYPDSRITLLCRPVIGELLSSLNSSGSNLFDESIIWSSHAGTDSIGRMGLIRRMRRAKFDYGIMLPGSLWTGVAMWLGGAKERIGYARDFRRPFLTHSIEVPQKEGRYLPISAIDYYLRLTSSLGCSTEPRAMRLAISSKDLDDQKKHWRALRLSETRRTLLINSNAATDPARCWPAPCLANLVQHVIDNSDWQIVVHCGPKERSQADWIANTLNNERVVSMGSLQELPITVSKQMISGVDLVLTTDSGPRHIAVALNKPVISLFGPTDPAWTRTYNLLETKIIAPVLNQATGPKHHFRNRSRGKHTERVGGNMDAITEEQVISAVMQKIEEIAAKPVLC